MRLAAAILGAWTLSVSGWALAQDSEAGGVELIVSGPPIEATETEQDYIYLRPEVPQAYRDSPGAAGILAQGWSMLGREDLGAKAGSDEYEARPCKALEGGTKGTEAALDAIAARAAATRIVIINESHEVTLHRDFSRHLIERLRPLGYTVFAAETFQNLKNEADPVEHSADLSYPRASDGYYLREPAFGAMVRTAKQLGFRLAAYEQPYDPERERPKSLDEQIASREQAQAENLAALLKTMGPDEKLVVHVGYAHARENETKRGDGFDTSWMAARLKRMTGVDPLTIAQTVCRGSSDKVQLSQAPERNAGLFDLIVDHPVHGFGHGRSDWRFADGEQAVDIPEPYASAQETLIIEAFAEGEPFEAVPVDRVWVEPGEDVKMALKPGRYTVRAVRPATLPERD
ncbi:MAG: hypothetical protein AAF249_10815 [Pseudomonadota bacterium]